MKHRPDPREIHQRLPFPFDNDRFPEALGAVVRRTVPSSEQPAREVVHTPDGSWLIGDGVGDPNEPGSAIATHIWHAVSLNGSIAELATMQPGHIAEPPGPDAPWTVSTLEGWDV